MFPFLWKPGHWEAFWWDLQAKDFLMASVSVTKVSFNSNRCVVWTGDDRVFFFNPTMQLSVWEKPVDLRHRGDLNRIIEDPPHKRKLEASAGSTR